MKAKIILLSLLCAGAVAATEINSPIRDWNASSSELKITPIYNDDTSKEIQIIMPKGKMMKDHSAPGVIVVQVLKGEIEFKYEDNSVKLKELMSIRLEPNVVHNLLATKDSIIRLSLSKNDNLNRVKSVKTN